jgi:hypothetical protein
MKSLHERADERNKVLLVQKLSELLQVELMKSKSFRNLGNIHEEWFQRTRKKIKKLSGKKGNEELCILGELRDNVISGVFKCRIVKEINDSKKLEVTERILEEL